LALNRLELLGREGAVHVEGVVEAVLDRGTEADARARPHTTHGRGEYVRRRVAQDVERLGGAAGKDLDTRVLLDRTRELDDTTIHLCRDGRLRQPRSDPLRHIPRRRPVLELEFLAVGQRALDHRSVSQRNVEMSETKNGPLRHSGGAASVRTCARNYRAAPLRSARVVVVRVVVCVRTI